MIAASGGLPPKRRSIWTRLKNTIKTASALTTTFTGRRGAAIADARLQEAEQARRQYPAQRRVVEERQAEEHGLKIEPVVVAGEQNAALQQEDSERRDEP